jgi:hypothetical protein
VKRAITRHRLTVVLLAIAAPATLGACGASSAPNGSSANGDLALAYARCLRANGVPDFPDPAPGAPLSIPSDIDSDAPAFRHAQGACARLMPGSASSASAAESHRLELLALAKCMRTHGVPSFADPTSSPPPPGNGNALGGNGVYLALGPPPDRQSPAFKRAAAACRLP